MFRKSFAELPIVPVQDIARRVDVSDTLVKRAAARLGIKLSVSPSGRRQRFTPAEADRIAESLTARG